MLLSVGAGWCVGGRCLDDSIFYVWAVLLGFRCPYAHVVKGVFVANILNSYAFIDYIGRGLQHLSPQGVLFDFVDGFCDKVNGCDSSYDFDCKRIKAGLSEIA